MFNDFLGKKVILVSDNTKYYGTLVCWENKNAELSDSVALCVSSSSIRGLGCRGTSAYIAANGIDVSDRGRVFLDAPADRLVTDVKAIILVKEKAERSLEEYKSSLK